MDNVISVFSPHRKSKTTTSENEEKNKKWGVKWEKWKVLPDPFSLKDAFVEESNGTEIHVVLGIMLRPEFVRNRHILSLF